MDISEVKIGTEGSFIGPFESGIAQVKRIEENEMETSVLQKRALRFTRSIAEGHVLEHKDLFPLRPMPPDGLAPHMISEVVGKRLLRNVVAEDYIRMEDIQRC